MQKKKRNEENPRRNTLGTTSVLPSEYPTRLHNSGTARFCSSKSFCGYCSKEGVVVPFALRRPVSRGTRQVVDIRMLPSALVDHDNVECPESETPSCLAT